MVLATKGGVDPKLMLEILDNSAAKSGLISYKAPFVFARNFTANFSVKWMHKDIGLDAGERSGAEMFPCSLTGADPPAFQTAIAAGHGDEDICSTIKVLEELADVEVISKNKYKEKSCFQKWNLLLLEIKPGGNSTKAETNLWIKTPEAILPGARKGLRGPSKKQTPNELRILTSNVAFCLIPRFIPAYEKLYICLPRGFKHHVLKWQSSPDEEQLPFWGLRAPIGTNTLDVVRRNRLPVSVYSGGGPQYRNSHHPDT